MRISKNGLGGLGICLFIDGWGINITEAIGHLDGGDKVCILFQPEVAMKTPILGDFITEEFFAIAKKYGKEDQLSFFGSDNEILPKAMEMLKNLGPHTEWLETFSAEIKAKKAEAQAMTKEEF